MADNPRKQSKSTTSRAPPPVPPPTGCPFRLDSDDERTRYEKLRLLPILSFKRLPRRLNDIATDDIKRMIRVVGWNSLQNGDIAYQNSVLEFYTTLEIFNATSTHPRFMRFRLLNEQYSLTDEALQRAFGIFGGGSDILDGYTYNTA